jgi:hypothetical protein
VEKEALKCGQLVEFSKKLPKSLTITNFRPIWSPSSAFASGLPDGIFQTKNPNLGKF